MSLVAVFKMTCCGKEIVHGRFRGDDMNHPTKAKCPFGCKQPTTPAGKPDRVKMSFERYQDERTLSDELKRFAPEPNDYWHKTERMLRTARAAAPSKARGKQA